MHRLGRPRLFHPGRPTTRDYVIRPVVGLVTVLGIIALVALTAALFRGSFTATVPVTVLSERSGLVLNPDAKVKMLGVQVGRVDAIERRSDGTAAIRLAMDPQRLEMIPANARVDIASSTVFGAKFIEFLPPVEAADTPMRPGDVVHAERVTVEINTVFEKLSSVLSVVEPEKLNQTLGALSSALDGRGEQLGRTIANFDAVLAELEPALPTVAHDIAVFPSVLTARRAVTSFAEQRFGESGPRSVLGAAMAGPAGAHCPARGRRESRP